MHLRKESRVENVGLLTGWSQINETLEPILISNQRFKSSLHSKDKLYPLSCYTGETDPDDLLKLKWQAEESGKHRALRMLRQGRNCNLTQEETILSVLQLSRYRRGTLALSQTANAHGLSQIRQRIKSQLPILLLVAFFPCKIRNPLKTFAVTGEEVDLSELGVLLRLHEITQAIKAIYPPGAKFLVACDGARYKDVGGHSQSASDGYMRNVRLMIDYLNINASVELIDESLFHPPDFEDVCQWNTHRVAALYRQGDEEIVEQVKALLPNLALMLDLDPKLPLEEVALAFAQDLDGGNLYNQNRNAYDLRCDIQRRAIKATFGYIAANWTMQQLKVFAQACPNAIKMTVHPKVGEIGIYPVNKTTDNAFPHNGQGHMNFTGLQASSVDEIRVSFAVDLMRSNAAGVYQGIILPADKYPFSNGKHPFRIIKLDVDIKA